MVEMKATGSKGKPISIIYSIKQAILLFVYARFAVNSDHCFVFATQREFSNEFDSAIATLRGLSIDGSGGNADLTQLFRVAAREAKESRA